MRKKKSFNRDKILKKTTNNLNLGSGLKIGGAITIGGAGLITLATIAKARTTVEMKLALCDLLGGVMGGGVVGIAGKKLNDVMMKKLIGKPLVCKKIANGIKNPQQRIFIRMLGNIDWKNKSIRESFRKWYLTKNATNFEINIAKRAMSRAMKKAKYSEELYLANKSL